jgi:lysophospholipase L1-like esterase
MQTWSRRIHALVIAVVVALAGLAALPPAQADWRWVTAWGTSQHALQQLSVTAPGTIVDGRQARTYREIFRPSVSGASARVRLANWSTVPVAIGEVRLAERAGGASINPDTSVQLWFSGPLGATTPGVTIPGRSATAPGEVVSLPAAINVVGGNDLALSIFVPAPADLTYHETAYVTSYATPPNSGNHTADTLGTSFDSWHTATVFASALEVTSSSATGSVIALGDSITDGKGAHIDAYERWTDVLARRLLASNTGLSVVNAGIDGDTAAGMFNRMSWDVLGHHDATTLIIFGGINDLGHGSSPADVETAYRAIITRAHCAQMKVIGATLLPAGGLVEVGRQAVNTWIRTSGAFDSVLDFDAVVRDPARPAFMLPAFDSGDHGHPSPAGMAAIANSVPLGALSQSPFAASCG